MSTLLQHTDDEATWDLSAEGNFNIPKKIHWESYQHSKFSMPDIDDPFSASGISEEEVSAPRSFPVLSNVVAPQKGRFLLLQQWQGEVLSVDEDTFTAKIVDKTNRYMPDEIVTISIELVSPSDLELLEVGAIFYWSISIVDLPGRGRIKESKFRFRRLSGWSQAEIERARRFAKKISILFS